MSEKNKVAEDSEEIEGRSKRTRASDDNESLTLVVDQYSDYVNKVSVELRDIIIDGD